MKKTQNKKWISFVLTIFEDESTGSHMFLKSDECGINTLDNQIFKYYMHLSYICVIALKYTPNDLLTRSLFNSLQGSRLERKHQYICSSPVSGIQLNWNSLITQFAVCLGNSFFDRLSCLIFTTFQ